MRMPPLLVGVLIMMGCASPSNPKPAHVWVHSSSRGLLALNRTPSDIYYAAFERGIVAVIDWAPCGQPALCRPRLAPAADTTIPYDSIVGWGPAAREAVFYWWHLVPAGGGGYRPDSIRGMVLGRWTGPQLSQ